jgi:nucleotide-binding universal stress UspA family protein
VIRTILVPVISRSVDDISFPAAVAVARMSLAHLDFLHVRRDLVSEIAGGGDMGYTPVSASLAASLRDVEDEREMSARQRVEEFCARENVAIASEVSSTPNSVSARWFCEVGDPADWVVRYGQTSELLVIARAADDSDPAALIETSLFDSGRPVFIPGPAPISVETVAIAWKPTREAARAVSVAMPFLAAAKRVVVLTIEEGEPSDPGGTARLMAALERHHIMVEVRHAQPDGSRPHERLLMEATRLDAGLLVMGGYGHSRLREWMFGGFTEHVLSTALLPVLMAH